MKRLAERVRRRNRGRVVNPRRIAKIPRRTNHQCSWHNRKILMIFTIELSGESDFRLQKDGDWRRLDEGDHALLESDFKTSNPVEVTNRTPYGNKIQIKGTFYKVSPTVGQISEIL